MNIKCGQLLQHGLLKMFPLPPPPELEAPLSPMLIVVSGEGPELTFLWDAETRLWASGDQLLFPAPGALIPDGPRGHWACAIDHEAMGGLVEVLLDHCFCIRWWAPEFGRLFDFVPRCVESSVTLCGRAS